MLFPKFHINEIKKQGGRDLERFDLDFDLPDHLLPEFPPAIFLTSRTDLGDVAQGKVVTLMNFLTRSSAAARCTSWPNCRNCSTSRPRPSWLKMALFLAIMVLEILPMVTFIRC